MADTTSLHELIGDLAPKLADLSEDMLFGDIWERPGLAKRERSLITVAALVGQSRPDQLRHHLNRALDNGVSPEELAEAITHLAFYQGWPSAMSAILLLKEVLAGRG
jgi:4-carboxymuconolactone decarboxylase